MEKCSICGKEFPAQVLKNMVHLVGRKAYIENVCPACQFITAQNQSYFYMSGKQYKSVVDINNGMAKPLCTQECILERLKELKTADELFSHSTTINLYGETDDKHMALYESFARENESEYGKITINRIRR